MENVHCKQFFLLYIANSYLLIIKEKSFTMSKCIFIGNNGEGDIIKLCTNNNISVSKNSSYE